MKFAIFSRGLHMYPEGSIRPGVISLARPPEGMLLGLCDPNAGHHDPKMRGSHSGWLGWLNDKGPSSIPAEPLIFW